MIIKIVIIIITIYYQRSPNNIQGHAIHDAWWWWLYSQTKSKVFSFSMFWADLRSHIGTNHIVHVCPLSVSQYPIGGIGNFSKCFPRFQVCMLFTITITILLKTTSFSQLTACIKYVHGNTFSDYLLAHLKLKQWRQISNLIFQNISCVSWQAGQHCAYSDIRRPSKAPIFRSSSSTSQRM